MPFKDSKEGTTHFQDDGCGEPAHNTANNHECRQGKCIGIEHSVEEWEKKQQHNKIMKKIQSKLCDFCKKDAEKDDNHIDECACVCHAIK